ncbi:uncharacterized protein KY384_000233 [Bacidia gigantensis]|uniref:uncharacterized protein n=1 Tax=Bacidia gigantensis TaxID=2732470 RepID=UPI001D03ADFC|nr:uncharacterized protein KY384_000233 [Bacidia gigantensis]KAG8526240.1 hypothetical protein KY384_000233 [Bacidia gigantensis]
MSAPVARELDEILESMLSLKPPGVTQSKITNLTSLCNANIQSATVLIQRIYSHIKKAPPSHKLGVLYVVDSVTRGWVEQAKKNGQSLGPSEQTKDGTYAAGHKLVTEMLPSFVNETINRAPEEQKGRISKLVDIWDRSSTFPQDMLAGFRNKLAVPTTNALNSTTPEGSPPKDYIPLNDASGMAPQEQNTSNILQALASMAKSNSNIAGQLHQVGQSNNSTSYDQSSPALFTNAPAHAQAQNTFGIPTTGNAYAGIGGGLTSLPALPQAQSGTINVHGSPAPAPQSNLPSPEQLQQQVQIIGMLQAQGIPQEQWAAVLSALMAAGTNNSVQAPPGQQTYSQSQYGSIDNSTRDRNGDFGMRSPPGRYRRSRSRSPRGYEKRRDDSPRRRRDSPSYGHGDERRSGNPYRQRSESPRGRERRLPPPGPKVITWDKNLPHEHIKVLSRTLFVGGVTCSEETLRKIFHPYGIVQTCIVNVDKRHAFVKMVSRKDAISAKEGMERYKSQDMQLRTRWGVGFGPRDCSDYSTGVSIIPVYKLTDADQKWMLTAEYGGTGGETLEGGMVVEEPDIEIGAGVSSKGK